MRRREFIILIGGAAAINPFSVWAQQSPSPLIGLLDAADAASITRRHEAFRTALRELGYIEGRNIRFEYRYADGFLDRLPGLAAELVQLNPKVIVSAPLPANLAVHKATSTIPIVMATGADPVGFGLIQSLSHPGGNITGLTNFAEELASKQLDLIRGLLPGLTRVGALVNVGNPLHVPQWRETQRVAARTHSVGNAAGQCAAILSISSHHIPFGRNIRVPWQTKIAWMQLHCNDFPYSRSFEYRRTNFEVFSANAGSQRGNMNMILAFAQSANPLFQNGCRHVICRETIQPAIHEK